MASFNRVFLMGNLTRDPELRYTPNGMAVVNLRLAVNHRYKDKAGEVKQETCFITAVVWDKQAESCNQYLQKGRLVLVEGRLQQRSWQDAEGKARNVIEVRADRVVFLGTGTGQRPAENKGSFEAEQAKAASAPAPESGETNFNDVAWPQEMDEQLS